jgi:hypothetical protein
MSGVSREANERLCRALTEVGWTPYDLAKRINQELGSGYVHRTTPHAWCRQGTTPRPPLPSVVAGLLGRAAGRIIRAGELWPGVADDAAMMPADHGLDRTGAMGWPERLSLDVESTLDSSDLMCVSGSDLLGFIRRWPPRSPSRSVPRGPTLLDAGDDPVLGHLIVSLARLRTVDDRATGRTLLTVVAHQQRLLAQLVVQEGGASVGAYRYLALLAQYCQFGGWLAMDLGDHARAQRNFLLGLRLAQFVDDTDLTSVITSCLAVQSLGRGAPADANHLAHEATHGRQTPATAAILWMRRGRMGAAVGDVADAGESFQRARGFLDEVDDEPGPPWAYWLTPEILSAEEGRSLVDLDQPRAAQARLARVLTRKTVTGRDRVLYGAALAQAHAAAGDLDQACDELHQSALRLPTTSSQRCRDLVQGVAADLSSRRLPARYRDLVVEARNASMTISAE